MAKQDISNYQPKQVQQLIEKNKGIEVFQRNNLPEKEIIKLLNEENYIVTDRKETKQFYPDFYENETIMLENRNIKKAITNVNSEELLDIIVEEIYKTLNKMKNNGGKPYSSRNA